MGLQLSFFEPETKKKREYNRVSDGRFATKEQTELERLRGERDYYKMMYESEQRKLKPVLKRLVSAERELNELKKQNEIKSN